MAQLFQPILPNKYQYPGQTILSYEQEKSQNLKADNLNHL